MASMATGSRLMTAEALIQLPRGQWRYELVRGELRRMSPSGHMHGMVAARVLARLAPFVEQNHMGETYTADAGFLLRRAPDTVRAPDVAFVTAARLATMNLSPTGFFPGAPDLAIEVVSPSDTDREVEEKTAEWLAAGTQVVVIVEPTRRTASVYRPGADVQSFGESDRLTISDLLPGWSLRVQEIFR
jgi:Uma2 family endonuclease